MGAQPLTIDFTSVPDIEQHASHVDTADDDRPRDKRGRLLTPKQIRARARRKANRTEIMTKEELEHLYPQKPIDEWDMDELAAGRPRNSKGSFTGPKPKWITREIHEQAMERFRLKIKEGMRGTTVYAMQKLAELLEDDEVDDKGKPLVSASTKADLIKFLIEHEVGKPTQRVESDVSVKLQGILGAVMVNPNELQQQYSPAHYPGITMKLAEKVEYDDDDDDLEG